MTFLQSYEDIWGKNLKEWPQYKYFTRPLYRTLGGNKAPLVSVPATFFITDYVIHQQLFGLSLLGMRCQGASKHALKAFLKPRKVQSGIWTSLSLPIAYNKEMKRRNRKTV